MIQSQSVFMTTCRQHASSASIARCIDLLAFTALIAFYTHTHTPTDRQFHNFTLIHTHACTLRCTHLNLTANDISMSSCNATHMTDTSQTILRTASSVDTMCRLIIYYINNIRIMTSFEWHLSTSCLTAVWAGILLGPFYGAIAVLCHMLSLSLWTSIRRRRVVRQ